MSFEVMTSTIEVTESLDTIGSNLDIAKSTFCAVGAAGEAVSPFVPLIGAVTLVISEIIKVYETVQYNKKICDSLMDRVNSAEAAIKTLKRRKTENEKNFRNQEYYKSFICFIEIMKRIKKFIVDVSNLHGYQKFVRSGSVKSKFDSLAEDFDKVMSELHFTMAVANEEQRRIDQIALESDIADMTKFLEKIGDDIIDQNQKINIVLHEVSLMKEKLDHSDSDQNIKAKKIKSTELNDPLKSKPTDRRGKNRQVIKKMYRNIEVACKPIDLQNSDPKEAAKIQGHLAILGKLRESLNIIRFYGLSYTENSDVMVFEWADRGSLRELYCQYDIAWHVKVQIALDICRGLTFLHSCDILHHDIRCEHIMMTTRLVPKIAKFKYSRMATGPTTDMKGVTDIMRWMAPEKLYYSTYSIESTNYTKKHVHVPYTFKCEIFSFGMLLWELVFEKIPYEKWDILKIKEHVLAGNREKITWEKASPDVEKLQKGLAKIIISAWEGDPAIRASLQNIFMNLDHLVDEYCTPDKEFSFSLLPDKELDLDGSLSRTVSISDEGIAAHKKNEHTKAWECFSAHAELNNALAKYWKGYYLWEGVEVEKDRKQACELFKEAADDEIPDAQLSANNNNATAQFKLREMYLNGKLGEKDEH
ncbi:10876_t:CDS:2 [Diversispora eburnea]|uniref:10876_t:CDS:1 n=1 Tax=Diversispora eburnea TaxID=1213867 RepID=A0A9N9AW79_9GLOM|nr:10876_t:CDS:2 [Diversispora eburnea]